MESLRITIRYFSDILGLFPNKLSDIFRFLSGWKTLIRPSFFLENGQILWFLRNLLSRACDSAKRGKGWKERVKKLIILTNRFTCVPSNVSLAFPRKLETLVAMRALKSILSSFFNRFLPPRPYIFNLLSSTLSCSLVFSQVTKNLEFCPTFIAWILDCYERSRFLLIDCATSGTECIWCGVHLTHLINFTFLIIVALLLLIWNSSRTAL